MKYRFLFVILSLILWIGCYEEDILEPTETEESNFSLPQGNHDYDLRIVDWHDRCGFYILYKFAPKDIYWDITSWNEAIFDSIGSYYPANSFRAKPADDNFVGKQVEWIENNFLIFYPDSTLRHWMPLKLLLCSSLERVSSSKFVQQDVRSGYNYIAVNNANEGFDLMTDRKKVLFKDTLNITFLYKLTDSKKIVISDEFLNVSSYTDEKITPSNMYAKGFIASTNAKKDQATDGKDYLKAIIKTPYQELIAVPQEGDTKTLKGILHSKKDTKGLIREKYDILIRHFKQAYGVDLQAIGNGKK